MRYSLECIDKRKISIVSQICNVVEQAGIVKRFIVFGSSVTNNCSDDSDIDICFDLAVDETDMRLYQLCSKVGEICNYNYDLVSYTHSNGKLRDEIDKKGVLVYEL